MMFDLIAFDMDGTLLTSDKRIDPETKEMIKKAAACGKTVAFCTGRTPIELTGYPEQAPGVRYAICNNGAILWDIKEQKKLYSNTLSPELMREILHIGLPENYLIQCYTENMYFEEHTEDDIRRVGIGEYLPMYRKLAETIPRLREKIEAGEFPVEKMALHMPGPEAEKRARARFDAAHLPVEIKHANNTSLEFTMQGVTKGAGLIRLCGLLGIPVSASIAVGDMDNDRDALLAAGLGIAMGNACEEIKKIAGAVVADNDHAGCAEAIRKYLLQENCHDQKNRPY